MLDQQSLSLALAYSVDMHCLAIVYVHDYVVANEADQRATV
jgi:hypothetical protein